ncbi:MAG TPA: protein kinase [Ktedonobacteraceae bacterium]|nr:protein kinase [Ktedonobacteraceae bacterium]
MSGVYFAYDARERREVALKVVDMEPDDCVQRFQREADALCLLKREHILLIFDAGERDGRLYFTMPYLQHGSLRERLTGSSLDIEVME